MSRPLLAPLSTKEERDLAVWLLNYCSHLSIARRLSGSGTNEPLIPPSIGEVWRSLPSSPEFEAAKSQPLLIASMAQRLLSAGFLIHGGTLATGSPPLNACYYSMVSLTQYQKKGEAWLTQVLGWEHLLRVAGPLVCQILGKDSNGDEQSGSGLLLTPNYVVTNQHVVEDMDPSHVSVCDRLIPLEDVKAHERYDVALVRLREPAEYIDAGVSFREHRSVEPILVAGFPPVPAVRDYGLTAQTGETCGATVMDFRGCSQMMFSAISRPGNSGGPVFAKDGRVVGIVSRSFEREKEEREAMAPLPFFAAVPASEVREAVSQLDPDFSFPWESWE